MAAYLQMVYTATIVVILGICVTAEEIKASCIVDKTSGTEGSPPIEGTIQMIQPESGDTSIKVSLKGFGNSEVEKHGFHVHAVKDLGKGCSNAGGHYNPNRRLHGAPSNPENKRHIGDLGNIEVPTTGEVMTEFTDPLIKLSGDTSIVGLPFVIHADEDDLGMGNFPDSNWTGHAGSRIGCCLVKLGDSNDITDPSSASHLVTSVIVIILAAIWSLGV